MSKRQAPFSKASNPVRAGVLYLVAGGAREGRKPGGRAGPPGGATGHCGGQFTASHSPCRVGRSAHAVRGRGAHPPGEDLDRRGTLRCRRRTRGLHGETVQGAARTGAVACTAQRSAPHSLVAAQRRVTDCGRRIVAGGRPGRLVCWRDRRRRRLPAPGGHRCAGLRRCPTAGPDAGRAGHGAGALRSWSRR